MLEPSAALTGRHGVAVSEFDLIVGLSGVAAYLLQRGYEPPMDVALQAILDSLVALTEETEGIPHWYTPYHLLAGEGMAEHYSEGNLNCGLAHGIPGPLAVMALGLEAGLPVEGLREAVAHCAMACASSEPRPVRDKLAHRGSLLRGRKGRTEPVGFQPGGMVLRRARCCPLSLAGGKGAG